ncbi:hypothetical protein ABR737_00525 [Streptomyces sp. Edi2]|uniref:hypothetical protein n=1 Tax=Streptomyces sp. Edi2 TaxID=3162528 RepID=UPI0033062CB9
MLTPIAEAQRQELLPGLDIALPTPTGRPATATIEDQFHAFDEQHPWIYETLERLVEERLAAGATRIGVKALFEALRWQIPDRVPGLNNNFTSLYARKLIDRNSGWVHVFELRRRRAR